MPRRLTEEILQLAYGEVLKENVQSILDQLDTLFEHTKPDATYKEFESYILSAPSPSLSRRATTATLPSSQRPSSSASFLSHPANGSRLTPEQKFSLFETWIVRVLRVFTEALPPKLYALERRYSNQVEAAYIQTKLKLPHFFAEQLRKIFYFHSMRNALKPELDLPAWKRMVCPSFITEALAEVVFYAKIDSYKPIWRFIDFVEFCIVMSRESVEVQLDFLLHAFANFEALYIPAAHAQVEAQDATAALIQQEIDWSSPCTQSAMLRMVYILSLSSQRSSIEPRTPCGQDKPQRRDRRDVSLSTSADPEAGKSSRARSSSTTSVRSIDAKEGRYPIDPMDSI